MAGFLRHGRIVWPARLNTCREWEWMVHRNCYRPRQNAEKRVCLCENAPNFGFFQYILAKKAADKKSAAFVCMCLRNLCLKNQTVRFLRPLARRRASTLRPFLEAMRFKSHERGCADASSAGKSASFRIPSFKVSPILGIFWRFTLGKCP